MGDLDFNIADLKSQWAGAAGDPVAQDQQINQILIAAQRAAADGDAQGVINAGHALLALDMDPIQTQKAATGMQGALDALNQYSRPPEQGGQVITPEEKTKVAAFVSALVTKAKDPRTLDPVVQALIAEAKAAAAQGDADGVVRAGKALLSLSTDTIQTRKAAEGMQQAMDILFSQPTMQPPSSDTDTTDIADSFDQLFGLSFSYNTVNRQNFSKFTDAITVAGIVEDLKMKLPPETRVWLDKNLTGDPNATETRKAQSFERYLQVVGTALSLCRQIIQDITQAEAALAESNKEVHRSVIEEMNDKLAQQINKIREQLAEIAKQKFWSKFAFIAGLVVSAVMFIATCWIPGVNILTIMFCALIFAATTTMAVMDYTHDGMITKGVQKFMKDVAASMDRIFGEGSGKYITAALVIILIIAVIALSRNVSFASIGANVAKMAVIQATMQVMMMLIMASNCFGEIFVNGIVDGLHYARTGKHLPKEDLEMACMIVNCICAAAACFACAYAAKDTFKIALQNVGEKVGKIMMLASILSSSSSIVTNSMQADIEFRLARIAQEKGDIDAAVEHLRKGIAKLLGIDEETLQEVLNQLQQAAQSVGKNKNAFLSAYQDMMQAALGV